MGDLRRIADYLKRIEEESSRNEMSSLFAQLISASDRKLVSKLIYFTQGILKPRYQGNSDFGIGEKSMLEAISMAYGFSKKDVEALYIKLGDLGVVAEQLCSRRKQHPLISSELSVLQVYDTFIRIGKLSGQGSQSTRIKRIAELLGNAAPEEARYIARYPTGHMRIGIGDPSILDALSIAVSGSKELREKIEAYYNITSDLARVAETVLNSPEQLEDPRVNYFIPVRPALAERLNTPEDIFRKLGRCAVEFKYDGMRLQVHKKGREIRIFSRNLEDVTRMFPDVVSAMLEIAHDFVAEGEALGYDSEKKQFLSFQMTMQRKRRYGIEKKSGEIPLFILMFDLLNLDGKDQMDNDYARRRVVLERIFKNFSDTLTVSQMTVVDSAEEIGSLFEKASCMGLEGIMVKDLSAKYVAGARKFAWIKLKKSYGDQIDTVDAVVIGYFHGKGERARLEFGGLLCAIYNPEKDCYETVAKASSGFSEQEMLAYRSMLEKTRVKEKPKSVESIISPDHWVEPSYVVTIGFDDITVSSQHTCCMRNGRGYALRFPRIISFRVDKSVQDSTTSQEIESLYFLRKDSKSS